MVSGQLLERHQTVLRENVTHVARPELADVRREPIAVTGLTVFELRVEPARPAEGLAREGCHPLTPASADSAATNCSTVPATILVAIVASRIPHRTLPC
jgi:hypothetical protein